LAPVKNGLFSWIHSLASLSDGLLLPLAGFDGYSTIQSLKLTFGLLLFMAIPSLGILLPFYYSQSDRTEIKYLSFSIVSIYGKAAWVPTIFCWLITLITFYVIFVFYRNFATLRQIYLTNPSSLMSFAHLRKITDDFGSLQDARAYFNVSTRSVILHSISANYGPKELERLLEGAGIGPVETIQQINSSKDVEKLMQKRDKYLTDLERELLAFFNVLKAASLTPNTPEWRAMQEQSLPDGFSDLGRSEVIDRIKALPRIKVEERCNLIGRLLTEPNFMAQYRIKLEVSKSTGKVDSLTHYYAKILEIEKDMKGNLKEFQRFHEEDLIRLEHPNILEEYEEDELPGPEQGYIEKTSLITLKKAFQFKSNLSDLRNTVWGSSYSAIVVFKTKKAASACKQLLLSSRPFSLQVQAVPIADDLIWSNASMPKADRAQREALGTVLYITFNMFFIFITSILSYLADLKNLEGAIPLIKPILDDLGPKIKSIIQGILTPLAFNIAIFIAPYILLLILKMTGKISKSDIQSSLMSNYAWFLFFQTSIIGAVFSSFFEIIFIWQQENLTGIIERIRNRMPNASHFFANVILQRASIGLMLVLIQPGVLLKKFAFTALLPNWYKTPRMKQEFRNPNEIQPGIIFPEYIVFPYQITMAFLTITPLSIIPGLLFYGVATFVFKHQFVYSYAVPNESGGLYWRKLSVHLISGVLMNQIFAVAQFRNHSETVLPTMSMLLLIGLTAAYIPFLERTFGNVCENLPITGEDRNKKRNITGDLVHKQTHLLQILQPIETAPIVFARIDAEGEAIEGYEQDENSSGGDRSHNNVKSDEVISISSFTSKKEASKAGQSFTIAPERPVTLNVPIIHHSDINEPRSYEVVPLIMTGPTSVTFDPYDVDHLTDRSLIQNPYYHPCMLEHSQVIILPAKLPALMKVILNYPSADGFKKMTEVEDSPIIMGESALSDPELIKS
jgi:hypothetical protein